VKSNEDRGLVIRVCLHDGRYHGVSDWPPAPARLFQALIAGAGPVVAATGAVADALRWLEGLPPPVIAVPHATLGAPATFWVPNNDLDAHGGDPARVPEIRTGKQVRPRLFDARIPLVYAWTLSSCAESEARAREVCVIGQGLYQLGRGVDLAWAVAEIVGAAELEALLSAHPGRLHRPLLGAPSDLDLACPMIGSFDSLLRRHADSGRRFSSEGEGRKAKQVFVQPPKPRFLNVGYDCAPIRAVFELRVDVDAPLLAWPLADASALVTRIRDAGADRLRNALPDRAGDILRTLVGRPSNGATTGSEGRVRLVPVPSIGHEQVDLRIRRILVEVPQGGRIAAEDVLWAFSGLHLAETGAVLTRADDTAMLRHYGIGGEVHRTWRTVTAAVLPDPARRRRIDPAHRRDQAKPATERAEEEARAMQAVKQALRHVGQTSPVAAIRVQREPFHSRGERAEAFASGTRFEKERMWHVELMFEQPVRGPVRIGDGRFLGLGVMAPARVNPAASAFRILDGLAENADEMVVTAALRRAVMARVQSKLGPHGRLPILVSGHAADGTPARSGHLAYVFDRARARLLVVAPRRSYGPQRDLQLVDSALADLDDLRAGSAGRLRLGPATVDLDNDHLFAPSCRWTSVTPYVVDRHAKRLSSDAALIADLRSACARARLPEPQIEVLETRGVPGVGLVGRAILRFAVAISGPILLGRTRHLGGGLFTGT